MKLVFLLLLLANLVLYAWQQGAFGRLPEAGREPARVARQIEPERIRVMTPVEVQMLKDKAREQAARQAPPGFSFAALDLAGGQACVEFGDFTINETARVRTRLDALELGDRLTARNVDVPGWFMVYMPPLKTRAEAERVAAELRKQGLRDFVVMGEKTPLANAIALASFRDAEQAKGHLADLEKRGVKGARVADKPNTQQGTRFVIRGIDAPTADKLQALQKDFAQAKFMNCGS